MGCIFSYVPEGTNFETARVFIHPRAGTISGEGEGAVRDLNDFACLNLAVRPGGQNLTVKEGRNIPTHTSGNFFVRHFNQGSPPNKWKTVAYLPKDGTVFMLMLSARDAEERDKIRPSRFLKPWSAKFLYLKSFTSDRRRDRRMAYGYGNMEFFKLRILAIYEAKDALTG